MKTRQETKVWEYGIAALFVKIPFRLHFRCLIRYTIVWFQCIWLTPYMKPEIPLYVLLFTSFCWLFSHKFFRRFRLLSASPLSCGIVISPQSAQRRSILAFFASKLNLNQVLYKTILPSQSTFTCIVHLASPQHIHIDVSHSTTHTHPFLLSLFLIRIYSFLNCFFLSVNKWKREALVYNKYWRFISAARCTQREPLISLSASDDNFIAFSSFTLPYFHRCHFGRRLNAKPVSVKRVLFSLVFRF